MKTPLDLKKEDLEEIMLLPLQIGIGSVHSKNVDEVLEGKIIECSLAANDPHLPMTLKFHTTTGCIKSLLFFQIKYMKEI